MRAKKVNNDFDRNVYETPEYLFRFLSDTYGGFSMDLACTRENCKVIDENGVPKGLFHGEVDSLKVDWHKYEGTLFINPPFGSGVLKKFFIKAYEEGKKGAKIVMITPNNVCSQYYYNFMPYSTRFVSGRVHFEIDGEVINKNMSDTCIHYFTKPREISCTPNVSWLNIKHIKNVYINKGE